MNLHANQHRWKQWVDPEQLELIEKAKRDLEGAWEYDKRHPKSFPINVDSALAELQTRLRNPHQAHKSEVKVPAPRPAAGRLGDLIDEKIVRKVFEHQNSYGYKKALALASEGGVRGSSAFRKIMNAMQFAYAIELYGTDLIPKPRVEFLHRALLEIAGQLDIDSLEGARNFLEYVCPCRKKHSSEAVRKLKKRLS